MSLASPIVSVARQSHTAGKVLTVAETTGPLKPLAGKRLLVMADCQNLELSAKRLGYHVSYRSLGDKLAESASAVYLHAVFAQRPGDLRRVRYFSERGWIPHAKTIRPGAKRRGGVDANIDHLLAFLTGVLGGFMSLDLVVLATGDGELVLDVAEALANLPRPKPVATLSLAGSTSFRIDARRCPLVAWNLELGKDCLRPLGHITSRAATLADCEISRPIRFSGSTRRLKVAPF